MSLSRTCLPFGFVSFVICVFRNYQDAMKLLQKATAPPPMKVAYHDEVGVLPLNFEDRSYMNKCLMFVLFRVKLSKTGCTSRSKFGPCMLIWRKDLERLRLEHNTEGIQAVTGFNDAINPFCLYLLQSCKAVYDRILDLRIATPLIVINYAMFLEENNYFEEAFKVNQNVS